MQNQHVALSDALVKSVGIKSIKKIGKSDVYCLASKKNGTMIANGIITSQCDALRYACCSAFPQGVLSHPDENLTIAQLRKQVYGEDQFSAFSNPGGGYY